MDRAILDAAGVRQPSLLVVPTAAARENPSMAAANGVAYFSELGARASALMVLDAAQAEDEELLAPVDSADVIYLTGGSPAHLLEVLAGSAFLGKIRHALDRGAVLAGSSAGAMVLGPWMRSGGWKPALGIAPEVAVLPHHERTDPAAVAKELAESAPPGVAVLGIDGRTGCLGGPTEWRVVGAGAVTVYHGGRWRRHGPGEIVELPAPTTGTDP